MKSLKNFATVLALLMSFSAHSADVERVTYSIKVPDAEGPAYVTAQLDETQTVVLDGALTEFVSEFTVIKTKDWQSLQKKGSTPSHDFVDCGKRTCVYGKKALTPDSSYSVQIKPFRDKGVLKTTYQVVRTTLSQVTVDNPEIPYSTKLLTYESAQLGVNDTVSIRLGEVHFVREGDQTIATLTLIAQ